MVLTLSRSALDVLGHDFPDVEEARQSRERVDAADIEEARQSREGVDAKSDAEVCSEADSTGNQRATTRKKPTSTITGFEALRKVEVEKVAVLSFRSLQLERIAEMQDDLLGLALAGTRGEAQDKDTIDKALRNYADALRNYETLSLGAQSHIPTDIRLVGKLALGGVGAEPRRSTVKELAVSTLVKTFLGKPTTGRVAWQVFPEILLSDPKYGNRLTPSEVLNFMERILGNLGFRELDQRGREERSQKRAFSQRIVMALFGGAAVIGPMLIMTLHPSRNTSLITVSLATFLFALLLAIIANDSAGKDVLGATAAYAAVLVVFVGTSIAPSS